MSSKPVLGYWDIRGLAQPIRYLLAYSGVDFEDKRYSYDHREQWSVEDKFKLGLDFPNLPYLIDGPHRITQSLAIIRYLARKYNLNGTTDTERIAISLLEQQITDLYRNITRVNYDPRADKTKHDFIAILPDQLRPVSTYLGTKPFIAGSNLSYVDFMLYEYLKKVEAHIPGALEPFANLGKFVTRMESMPQLSAYIKKQRPCPFNAVHAKWNVTL